MSAGGRRTTAPGSSEDRWLIVAGVIDLTINRWIEKFVGRSIAQCLSRSKRVHVVPHQFVSGNSGF